MKFVMCFLIVAALALPAAATTVLAYPSTAWHPVNLGSGNPMDYLADQQTGQAAGDIVGTASDSGLFMLFDSTSPGALAFRVRLGAADQGGDFSRGFFIGIDANNDGKLDLFTGVDNTGSNANNRIKIFAPGNGLNDGPSTTTMDVPTQQKVYVEDATNFDYRALNVILDPYGTAPFDLNVDGNVDYYLSFAVPFADIVSEMSRLSGITITANSPLQFVAVTSTQNNSFNQDLGGVQGGVSSKSTWTDLGGISTPYVPLDQFATPEPGLLWMSGLALAGVLLGKRSAKVR